MSRLYNPTQGCKLFTHKKCYEYAALTGPVIRLGNDHHRHNFCYYYCATFEVTVAASIEIPVLWLITPCVVVQRYQRFGGTSCLHLQGSPRIGASTTLKIVIKIVQNLVNTHQSTRRQVFNNNPQGSRLRGRPKTRRWKCVQILINTKLKAGKRG